MSITQCIFHVSYAERERLVAAKVANAGGDKRIQCALCQIWIRDYELLKEESVAGILKHCELKLPCMECVK